MDQTKDDIRAKAVDLISKVHCEGPSGDVGGTLAEAIVARLEGEGFVLDEVPPKDEAEKPAAAEVPKTAAQAQGSQILGAGFTGQTGQLGSYQTAGENRSGLA